MIRTLFIDAIDKHSGDAKQKKFLWEDITSRYSARGRHYHTLTHLENLAEELMALRQKFKSMDTIVFAIVYHDIIYNTLRSNNEERSAGYARMRLSQTAFAVEEIERCVSLILATRKHQLSDDEEINLFTDADLSILGYDEERYRIYTQQIRKEYFLFPDFLYVAGRKKILDHFLKMERIFKTDAFFDRYEIQARKNIKSELKQLEKK